MRILVIGEEPDPATEEGLMACLQRIVERGHLGMKVSVILPGKHCYCTNPTTSFHETGMKHDEVSCCICLARDTFCAYCGEIA